MDLNQAFGGQAPKTLAEEGWHNEQNRKKYDIIRVENPTQATVKGESYPLPQKDFYVEYDTNQYQKIPFGGTIDIPRYIAIRYVEHKKDDIVNYVTKKLHDDFLIERDKKGFARYTDKATENKETYETDSYPKNNDPVVIAEVYEQLWVGLVHEFGRDIPPTNMDMRSGEVDLTPVSQKVLDTLNKRRVEPADNPMSQFHATYTPAPAAQSPAASIPTQPSGFAAMNQKLSAEEITQE